MWSAITTADVLDEFTPQEQATLQNLQSANNTQQAVAILGRILTREVNAARGSIIAGGGRLDADGFIPDQLRPDVIAIARWRWLISFPQLKVMQTKERNDAYNDARDTLKDVSTGKIKIELPAAATAENNPAPVNAVDVARKGRHVRTSQYDKLGET